jgi:transcription antitermination protein NusB
MTQRSAWLDPDERSVARERALHLLYEADVKGVRGDDVLSGQVLEVDGLARLIVEGVAANASSIDEQIASHLVGWTLERMPIIDKLVLRIATFELIGRPETPTAVILNEAVELAKRFSTDESPRFVNGVLGALARDIRPS